MISSQTLGLLGGVSLAALIGLYLYTFYKFHKLVLAERPEWVDRKGSLSFMYQALPRVGDPNVQAAVLRTVFSSRVRELRSPLAVKYAHRIRLLLFVVPLLFVLILVAEHASAA
jgi:hypothetical protein